VAGWNRHAFTALNIIAGRGPVPGDTNFTDLTSPVGDTTTSTSAMSSMRTPGGGPLGMLGRTSCGGTTSGSDIE
jgi:hypothetical protein